MTALLLTACLLADPRVTSAQTEHYCIQAEEWDAAETGVMLEQLYSELARYFARVPEGPLQVEIYATAERFKAALARDGQQYMGGGGYYAPVNRKVYLHVQPSRYYTRQLILHEAAHQFHFLVATDNQLLPTTWYLEGLAEFYAMHNWDGKTLYTGAVPAISLEDYPAKALQQLDEHAEHFADVVAGVQAVDRPLSWAMVHYLRGTDDHRFRMLAAALDRRADARTAWRRVYGRVTPATVDRLRRWILAHQQPWESVWIEWQQSGGALEGFARWTGLAVLKNTPHRLVAELTPVNGSMRAGLIFGYQNPENFQVVHVFEDGRVWIVARENGQWRIDQRDQLPERPERCRIDLECRDGQAQLAVNGQPLDPIVAEGKVGLTVDGCQVRFEVSTSP